MTNENCNIGVALFLPIWPILTDDYNLVCEVHLCYFTADVIAPFGYAGQIDLQDTVIPESEQKPEAWIKLTCFTFTGSCMLFFMLGVWRL